MKILVKIITVGLSLLTFTAVAAPSMNNHAGYVSSMQSNQSGAIKKLTEKLYPATDITVVNAAYDSIFTVVPNTPINDLIYPSSQPDHIRNFGGALNTFVVLQDVYRGTFFNRLLCPRALVVVYGSIGNYNVIVDNEYCN